MSTFEKFQRKFGRDEKSKKDGRWLKIPDLEGLEVLVRPESANDIRDYVAAQVRSQRKLLVKYKGVLPAAMADRNELELCLDKILIGWRGMKNEQDEEVPFNRENAKHYLTKYPEFLEEVMSLSRDGENFGITDPETIDEMVGNS